jgi:cell division protein FtsB
MKKILNLCTLLVCLALPKAYSLTEVIDAGLTSFMAWSHADQIVKYGLMIAAQTEEVANTYQQVQMMIEAEKRAINNLSGVLDVKNFDDFMKWQNRQLYLEREAEDRFYSMGVKIGGKNYTVTELNGIPGALHNTFGDPYWDDFTEEQRAEMYNQLGLSPANYNYVKLWSAREDYYAKKILSDPDRLAGETEEAGKRYQSLLQQYRQKNQNLDANELAKNQHASLMQIEMVLRGISEALAEKERHEYEMRQLGKTPANPPGFSAHWDSNLFASGADLTNEKVEIEYEEEKK